MFEDFEFSPIAAGAGLVGGIFAMVIMKQVEVGLIYKIGGFVLTSILCYFIFDKVALKG
jgi:hypothetical protein